jgi:hypothetical protein
MKVMKDVDNTIPTYTMRDFLRNSKQASALLEAGQKINVTKNGELLFTATPTKKKQGVTMKNFSSIKAKSGEVDLSQQVDKLVYGK